MERTVRKWIAAVALVGAMMAAGGTIYAGENQKAHLVNGPVPQGFEGRAELRPGQESSKPKENPSSGSAVMDAKPGQTGGFLAGVLDHVKGLGLGLLVGVGVGVGIIVVGALLLVSWPVLLAAAGFAALGGAIYGVFKGAQRFNVLECAVMSLISGVSGGLGHALSLGGLGGSTLWMAKAAIDMLAGGLMQTTAYMFGTDHPTGQGALASFGIGAATAGVFLGAGFAFGKLKMALGFTGSAETAISRAAGPTVEQPAAGAVVAESNGAALTRAGVGAGPVATLPKIPGDVGALEELAPSLKSKLSRLPESMRTAFGEAIDKLETAPNKEQYIKELEQTADWARRNPGQARRIIDSSGGLSGVTEAYKNTPNLSSAKLARNMEREFDEARPKGYAAHHIVPGNEPEAERARMILKALGIDINDASNGVYLPHQPGVGTSEVYHPTMHTPKYFNAVAKRLEDATNADDAMAILGQIADELRAGTFPH